MPVISMFYGVIILLYYFDNRKHHQPHIHVQYSDEEAVISIQSPTATSWKAHSGVLNSS